MRIVRLMCALCAFIIAFGASAFGQAVTGSVLGTVSDATGAVVANAKVTLTEVNTGVSRSVQTNTSGNYSFPDVAGGNYSVTIEAPGFKKDVRQNISVAVNTSTRVDAQLQPGEVTQSIEVTAAPPALQTDRADTETSIQTAQTANLPVGTNRNFQGLLNLVPGT